MYVSPYSCTAPGGTRECHRAWPQEQRLRKALASGLTPLGATRIGPTMTTTGRAALFFACRWLRQPCSSTVHRNCSARCCGPSPPAETTGASCSRSEEHTSELQYQLRISYNVFCLK